MILESLARLGYASKAVVYTLVGVLAAAAALNMGGRITDTSGALRVLLRQPLGTAVLVIIAIGLCGYAAWRVLDAFADPDHHGSDFGGLVTRIGNVIRGLIYGALGVEAFRLVRGLRGSSGREAETWTGRIMDLPLGEWIVGIAGMVVVAYGISEIVTAARERSGRLIDPGRLPPAARETLINVGRFGVGARAVIIVAIGVFLVRAALQHDPSVAAGTRESILELAGAFEGRFVLTGIALGMVAYGVDQAVHARCRRIRSPI